MTSQLPGSPTHSARQPVRIHFVAVYSDAELETFIERALRLGIRAGLATRLQNAKSNPVQLGAGDNAWVFTALTHHLEAAGVLEFGGSRSGGRILASFDMLHLYIPAAEIPSALLRMRAVDLGSDPSFHANVQAFFDGLEDEDRRQRQIDAARYTETLQALITYLQLAAIQCTGLIVLLKGPRAA